jgi:hypothetical protein
VLNALGASPVAGTVAALSVSERAALWRTAEQHLAALVRDGQVRTQMVSNIAKARKP